MPTVFAPALVRFALFLAFTMFLASGVRSQQSPTARTDSPAHTDSIGYALPADSVHKLDSAYRARKVELDRWVRAQQATAHPQEDFISVYAEYGGYLQILPRDINQLFSERTLRADPTSDRNEYATVDRAVIIGVQAQLASTWGIYFEYDLIEKWFNTAIDSVTPAPYNISNAIEELDLTEHSFVVGGMFVLYSGRFYRLRLNGGIGGVIALTTETESPGDYSRAASAIGYQVNFDILNDFRIMQNLSFSLDILTRTVTTSELKTPGGQTLDAAFGAGNPSRITFKPTASNIVYGLAAGLVYYF